MLLNTNKHHYTETLLIFTICLDLGLFMLYISDLFFIFIFIFTMVNHIISLIQTYLLFCLFFRICSIIFGWSRGWRMWIIFKYQKANLRVLLSISFIFANFSLALLIKVLLISIFLYTMSIWIKSFLNYFTSKMI